MNQKIKNDAVFLMAIAVLFVIVKSAAASNRQVIYTEQRPSQQENKQPNLSNYEVTFPNEEKILAKDMPFANNPKLSGQGDENLKITDIGLSKQQKLWLKGIATANTIIKIFVFSQDPVVITLKTDANGNWSYELRQDIENGSHEAFVVIANGEGKIISKSEPMAFVKTAEAANILAPTKNDLANSPLQQKKYQYILTAIVAIGGSLLIVLALIGILTYKRTKNERAI